MRMGMNARMMWQGLGGDGGSRLAPIETSGANLSVAHGLKKFDSPPPPPESALEHLDMRLAHCKKRSLACRTRTQVSTATSSVDV
eukprot:3756914-Amphidinium_carterae.1